MRIKHLHVNNFLSIGDIHIDLDRQGLNLVLGKNNDSQNFDSNGSGKSSLFEAIIWCLFGTPLRDLAVDEVVRKDQDSATVSVELDPEDGSGNVTIRRLRLRNKRTVVEAITSTGAQLFPANNNIDFQKELNLYLGMDYKTFINSVYFGKGLTKFFMSSTDAERKDLLDTILQVVSFDEALERAKARNKIAEGKYQRILNEIELSETRIEERTESLRNFEILKKTAQEEFNNKDSVHKKELKEIDTELISVDKKIGAIKDYLKKHENDLDIKKKEIDDNSKELLDKNLKSESSTLGSLKKKLNISLKEIEGKYSEIFEALSKEETELLEVEGQVITEKTNQEGNIKYLQNKLNENKVKTEKYSKLELDSTCPTCLQQVGSKHVEAITKRLVEKKATLEEQIATAIGIYNKFLEEAVNPLKASKKQVVEERKGLEIEKATDVDKEKALQEEQYFAEKTRFSLDREAIGKLTMIELEKIATEFNNNTIKEKEKLIDLNSTKFQLESKKTSSVFEINRLKEDIKKYDGLISTLNESITKFNKQISKYNNLATETRATQERTAFWVEAFGPKGIRSFIFEQALPFLTERANFYSTHLTGSTVKIDIAPTTTTKTTNSTKEKIHIAAINTVGADVYAGNSSGESRRIDLCILLALQDLIQSRASKVWSTVIFDEVFDTLDTTGIQLVIELFRSFTDKSIYIISHNSELKQYFDTCITVVKENAISSIGV